MTIAPHRLALITGASSGIGAEFARQLAGRAYDLVLCARREDRLQALADELHGAYGVTVERLSADLAYDAGIVALEERIAGLPALDLLVNNAGFGTSSAFRSADFDRQLAMVDVHVVATMRLSRAALPGMIERRSGGIINVASVAGFFALPGNITYCATKGYLIIFSRGLAAEVGRTGVRVQALCPGFTRTEFHGRPDLEGFERNRIPGFLWSSAEFMVRGSLAALDRGQVVCIPGLLNKLLALLGRTGIVDRLAPLVLMR